MTRLRQLDLVNRILSIGGAVLLIGVMVATFLATRGPRSAVGKKRIGGPLSDQAAGGSLDYWIGRWDAKVDAFREYPKLSEGDREVLEWSRTVLGKALGDWLTVPATKRAEVESPLKLFVPSENERARRYGEAWTDPAGNEWRPTDGQRKDEFWIQTRVRFRGRDVLLGMSFADVKDDPSSFGFFYLVSTDNGGVWLLSVSATYTRAGSIAKE